MAVKKNKFLKNGASEKNVIRKYKKDVVGFLKVATTVQSIRAVARSENPGGLGLLWWA